MSHDLVIRGGTIYDGTGKPGVFADLAIDGDRITQIGGEVDRVDNRVRAVGDLADRDEHRSAGVDHHRFVARPFDTTMLSR